MMAANPIESASDYVALTLQRAGGIGNQTHHHGITHTSQHVEDDSAKAIEARQYVTHLVNVLHKGEFDDEEEKSLLIERALGEICKCPVILSNDAQGSVRVEHILAHCDLDQVLQYLAALHGCWRRVACALYGSRALEFAFYRVFSLLCNASDEKTKKEMIKKVEPVLYEATEEMIGGSGAMQLFFNVYGSHPMRGLLRLLAGCSPSLGGGRKPTQLTAKQRKKQRQKQKATTFAHHREEKLLTGNEFSYHSKKLIQALDLVQQSILLANDNELTDIVADSSAGPTLQVLFRMCAGCNALDTTLPCRLVGVPHITSEEFNTPMNEEAIKFLIKFSKDPMASHSMEAIVENCDLKLYHKLVKECFAPNFPALSKHRTSNFVMQRVIDRCVDGEQFDALIQIKEIPKLMTISPGVVVAIVKASAKLNHAQQQVYEALCDISGVLPHFAFSLLSYRMKNSTETISYHGAMVLIRLLEFQPALAGQVVSSVMEISNENLASIAQSAFGTRVLDAIMTRLPLELKKDFIVKFLPHLTTLAQDKFGSRWVDRCFDESSLETREQLAEVLSQDLSTLENNMYARFVVKNCGIQAYTTRYESWAVAQKRRAAGKRLFGEFLSDEVVTPLPLSSVKIASHKEDHQEIPTTADPSATTGAKKKRKRKKKSKGVEKGDASTEVMQEKSQDEEKEESVENQEEGVPEEGKKSKRRKRKRNRKRDQDITPPAQDDSLKESSEKQDKPDQEDIPHKREEEEHHTPVAMETDSATSEKSQVGLRKKKRKRKRKRTHKKSNENQEDE